MARWYVAFMTEVSFNGVPMWTPNARIVREHPLLWHASVVQQSPSGIVLLSWTELTDNDPPTHLTQIIDEAD